MNIPQPHSKPIRLFYFWTGIIATLVYRLIIVLNEVSTTWVKVAWYVGTVGFILYFWHRYQISETRAKLIRERQLDRKVAMLSGVGDDDKAALGYILGTLSSTKEKWNYIAIFVFSGVALVIGVVLDVLGSG
ncbi:MAG: hypothetical protein HY340_03385 [Candidatus Kerfeldbacteria bacterium]|nr:hypothetical protein [Candidatus Kerfeldbacteria bacterium]